MTARSTEPAAHRRRAAGKGTGWQPFPYENASYRHTAASLKKAWKRLHAGDAEPMPTNKALIDAWIAFHAGEFEAAIRLGLAQGPDGYTVANKAAFVYADYLEKSARKFEIFEEIVSRCEELQALQPANPAAYYWHACALGRYAQGMSVVNAIAQGIAGKLKRSLDTTLKLQPQHADAHIALGIYYKEIINTVGAAIGRLTYGATREQSYQHFLSAIEQNPESAIARIEYANALLTLEGKKKAEEAHSLYQEAAALTPRDAMECLDIELAKTKLSA